MAQIFPYILRNLVCVNIFLCVSNHFSYRSAISELDLIHREVHSESVFKADIYTKYVQFTQPEVAVPFYGAYCFVCRP